MELYLFDANETQFAQIHSNKGGSSNDKQKSFFACKEKNRKRIQQDSLIFLEVNEADNRTTTS